MSGAASLTQALAVTLPVLYFAAAFLYGMQFGGRRAPRVEQAGRVAAAVALGAHGTLLFVHAAASRAFPAFETWTNASAVAFGLALLYLFTRHRVEDEGAGALVYGVAGMLQLFASALGPLAPRASGPPLDGIYLSHAATSVFAASALLLSGLHGLLYLAVLRRMQGGNFGPIVAQLPDLRSLALLTRRAALAGFLLLTLGVNLGIGWAHATDTPGFGYTDPWVLAMIAPWLHFGLGAFSRAIPGFSAQRASFAATVGLTVFLAAGLVTLLPRASFHWTP